MKVNNEIYDSLGERWYQAEDDPIALLRAESRLRNPLIAEMIRTTLNRTPDQIRVLDLACGAGFLANDFAQRGFQVTGLDQSEESLAIARKYDVTGKVTYQKGDALRLPFADGSFDVVTVMDFLEHVENPKQVIQEISRVLVPGGVWAFHTFNRTRAAHWIAIRAVERFVANVPENLHLDALFLRPSELEGMAKASGLTIDQWRGLRPALDLKGVRDLLKIAVSGRILPSFRFVFTPSLQVGYLGWGRKSGG